MASWLKVKRRDALLLAVFYAVVGILELASLIIVDIRMIWIGALAVLSLIAAYGLLTVQKWSVWLLIGLFFPQFVFAASTLYGSVSLYSLNPDPTLLLLNVTFILFMIFLVISFLYIAVKRKTFGQM